MILHKNSLVILGASNNPHRYSFKALQMARERGINVFLVHPMLKEISGVKVFASVAGLTEVLLSSAAAAALDKGDYLVDTLSLYVRKEILLSQLSEITALRAQRIIANPGADEKEVLVALQNGGTNVQKACTLVLLSTGQY